MATGVRAFSSAGGLRIIRLVGDEEASRWVAASLQAAGVVALRLPGEGHEPSGRSPVLWVARPAEIVGVSGRALDAPGRFRNLPCLIVLGAGDPEAPEPSAIPLPFESVDVVREPDDAALLPLRVRRLLSLHRRRSQFEDLLHNLTDVVYTRTFDGRLTSLNAAAERLFGRRRSEALGRPLDEILPDPAEVRRQIGRLNVELEESGVVRGRYRVPDATGRVRLFEGESYLLRDVDGEPAGVQVVLTDITEETASREKLENEATRNEILAAVAAAARDSFDAGPLLESATSLLGTRLQARDVAVWLLDEARASCRAAAHWRASQDVPALAGRTRLLAEDVTLAAIVASEGPRFAADGRAIPGGPSPVALLPAGGGCGVPIRYAGDAIGALFITWEEARPSPEDEIVFFRRLADQLALAVRATRLWADLQKQLDALAEAQARREAADRDRSQLTAMLVHDLKNPLSAIGAALELTRDKFASDGGDPRLARMLESSLASARSLEGLIEDALLVYRADDAPPPAMTRVPPQALLSRPLEEARWLAEARRVSLEVDVAPGLDPVAVDAPRYARAASNLVLNAIKFSPRGGSVRVSASLEAVEGAPWFCLRVSDSGPGIPAEDRHRLTTPWVRLQGAVPGTGLGLTVVRRVAELHAGRLEISTNSGCGSIFSLLIPLAHAQA